LRKATADTPIIFVGNKIDMRDDYRAASKDMKTAPI